MPIHQTLQQKRAEAAFNCAKKASQDLSKDKFKEYVNLVKKLPAMIHTNGLGQALAFLAAKAGTKEGHVDRGTPHGLLYTQLEKWLTTIPEPGERFRAPYTAPVRDESNQPTRLIYRIACGDSATYRRATAETLAFLNWLKSLADALQD